MTSTVHITSSSLSFFSFYFEIFLHIISIQIQQQFVEVSLDEAVMLPKNSFLHLRSAFLFVNLPRKTPNERKNL